MNRLQFLKSIIVFAIPIKLRKSILDKSEKFRSELSPKTLRFVNRFPLASKIDSCQSMDLYEREMDIWENQIESNRPKNQEEYFERLKILRENLYWIGKNKTLYNYNSESDHDFFHMCGFFAPKREVLHEIQLEIAALYDANPSTKYEFGGEIHDRFRRLACMKIMGQNGF